MFRARVVWVGLALAVVGAVLLVRLLQLQIVEAEDWRSEGELLAARERSLAGRRGGLFDRLGRPIAEDEESFAIDFEYRTFRARNPLAQTTHVLGIVSPVVRGCVGPSLTDVARDPAAAVRALGRLTLADVAEIPGPADRLDVRLCLERLLTLDARERQGLRSRFRDGVRARRPEPLEAFAPDLLRAAAARVDEVVRDFEELDARLGVERGTTLARVEAERMAILSDVEARLAQRAEAEAEGGFDVARERDKARRQRESWLVRLSTAVPYEAAECVSFRAEAFAGFTAGPTTVRRYRENLLPWFVGTVRVKTEEELRRARDEELELESLTRQLTRSDAEQARFEALKRGAERRRYPPGDVCGVDGIEREFESDLHGTGGSVVESIGRRGGRTDRVDVVPPDDGADVTLTIDLDLQRAAESILREGVAQYGSGMLRGALVVLDVESGDVICAAAQPDFVRDDLKDKARFARLLAVDGDPRSPLHPLHHRAYRPWLPPTPGSTFKVVTALAALDERIVDWDVRHRCDGKIGTLRCDGVHGSIDLATAMEVSCNVYFGWLGEQLGLERLRRHSERFGFGEKTGFDRSEVKGGFEIERADAELLRRCGVGYQIGVTPLQVARAYAAIGNGGRVPRLRPVRAVGGVERSVETARELGYKASDVAAVKSSLRRVVFGDRGTARDTGLSAFRVAGKTGTAEVDSKRDLNHAWFAGYVPLDRPRIAFAVYAELVPLHGKDVAPLIRSLLGHPAMAPYLDGE